MPRLKITLKGSSQDHTAISDNLSDEDAAAQLEEGARHVALSQTLELPWLAVFGTNILAVQVIEGH